MAEAHACERRTRHRLTYRRLAALGVVLTLALIMLGAYVRLSDAGLGCPDWPGCYGQLSPAHAGEQIAAAVRAQGGEHGPVSVAKAWREMGHRYAAMLLGLLVVGLCLLGWRWRRDLAGGPWLASALVGVVVLQGLFGKWTVTLLLDPAIVTAHLLGGMFTLALLVLLWQRQGRPSPVAEPARRSLRLAALVALLAVVGQIALGGWLSTNHAALVCADFPTCRGQWWPPADWRGAFRIVRDLAPGAGGEPPGLDALTTMHMAHRLGALVVTVACLWLVGVAIGERRSARPALALLAVLGAQIALGIGNVLAGLPLPLAVAHNGGAALLLALIVTLLCRLPAGRDRAPLGTRRGVRSAPRPAEAR